jgi:hypothetical protein
MSRSANPSPSERCQKNEKAKSVNAFAGKFKAVGGSIRAARIVASLGPLAAFGAAEAPADPGVGNRLVQLPPFIVDDSSLKYSAWNWGYMAFPGYEVLTYCNRITTNGFVTGISRQLSIFHEIAPAVFESEPTVPTALILMDSDQERTISEDMKRVMRERPSDTNTAMGGLTSHRIYLPQLRLHDSESTAINLILGNLDQLDVVVLEPVYVRYLLEARNPRLPTWYVEAMTDLYRRAYFGSASVTFTPISWISDKETVALQENPKHGRTLLPMDSVLFTRPGSEGSDEDEKARVRLWDCQSELFLQWVLADRTRGRIAALKKFLDCGDQGRKNEKILRLCFGLGYAQLRDMLNAFLPKAVLESVTFYADADGITVPLRDATTSEYARIWGNWELMEIPFVQAQDPLLVYPYLAQADHTLKNGYKRGERDPGFLAVLGLYAVERGDTDQARPILESAVAANAPYPRIYDELARIRFKEAHADPKGPNSKLSPDQIASVMALLQGARRLSPPQRATYLLYALALASGPAKPTAADWDVLDEGLRTFPGESELATMVAALKDRPLGTATNGTGVAPSRMTNPTTAWPHN